MERVPTTVMASVPQVFPSLATLPQTLQQALGVESRTIRVAEGTVLFDVGHACTALPLIIEGAVRIVRRASSGRAMLLYRVGPGDFCILTTTALLGDVPYDATGIVEADVSGLLVPKSLVLRLFEQHAPFRRALFATFASRVSQLMMLVEQAVVGRLNQRVAALLLERGPAVRSTHQGLADELGTAREVVSRILESFEAAGLVSLHRGQVDVVDQVGLARIAQPT